MVVRGWHRGRNVSEQSGARRRAEKTGLNTAARSEENKQM